MANVGGEATRPPEDSALADVVSLFADRRGGPGNFDGSGYQIKTMIRMTLEWIRDAWSSPATTGVVSCEPRYLVAPGQVGFDIGLRDAGDQDDLVEVKLNPTPDEVTRLVATARTLVGLSGGGASTVRLISERRTRAYTALERLVRHGEEATEAAHFSQLVRGSGDDLESALYDELAGEPFTVVKSIKPPSWCGQEETNRRIVYEAKAMSDNALALVDRLFRQFHEGAGTRRSFDLRGLIEGLLSAGLLVEPTRVDIAGLPDRLVEALVVLQECPVPLPADVLAEGLGISEADLDSLLREHIEGGYILEDGHLYWSPPKAHKVSVDFGASAVVKTLSVLNRQADNRRAAFATQVPNAVSLARAAQPYDLPVVAFTFKAFDKAAKAWGDLTATYDLANISNDALVTLMQGDISYDDRVRYASWRAQTFICGQGWVFQRVERLEEAAEFMRRAKQITDANDDIENRAFTLKCEGRLLRMQAEHLDHTDPERDALLTRSVELLTEAKPAFEELLMLNPRFEEDRGECVSLLARTVATQGQHEVALELVTEALTLLDGLPDAKAMADLVVLQAEIDAALRGRDDATGVLVEHRDNLVALIERHTHTEESPLDRSRSEVTARIRVVLGGLHEAAGDNETAHRLYMEAAEQYEQLAYDGRRDHVRWLAFLVDGRQLPDDFLAALDTGNVPIGARLRAAERYAARYATDPSGSQSQPPQFDTVVMDGIIRQAIAEHTASNAIWGERPTSA